MSRSSKMSSTKMSKKIKKPSMVASYIGGAAGNYAQYNGEVGIEGEVAGPQGDHAAIGHLNNVADLGVPETGFAPISGYNNWSYNELVGPAPSAYGLSRGRKVYNKRPKIVLEEMEMSEEQKQDNVNDLQKAFQLIPVKGRTYINAVVYDKNKERHANLSIPCHQGSAFDKGYAYDQATDSYIVNAQESMPLGYVPIAYELKMPDSGNWRVSLPLPPAILDRYFSAAQRKALTTLRERYGDTSRFTIEFVQMMGCET